MSEKLERWSNEHLKVVAFEIATQYLMDKSAGKSTPMAQLIETKMIEMRNEYAELIATLETHLILVSRELASTDNADRYYRGFNDGYDHANSIKETDA